MRKYAVALTFLLVASGCGGSSDSAELQALREKVEALEAQATMVTTTIVSPSEVWCSSLEREFSHQQIEAGLMDAYPDPGVFVLKALDMTREGCPSELESNTKLRMWFMNWDSYGDSLPETWCSQIPRHFGFPSLAYLWSFADFFPDERLFAPLALRWMSSTCPDLIFQEEVALWLQENGL
jgi:hypothetical protein